jgi:hypothetical protein
MTKTTKDLIVKIVFEIVDWLTITIKQKRRNNKNDGKGNSKKKQKSRTAQGNPGG